jgi:hypothetical protein
MFRKREELHFSGGDQRERLGQTVTANGRRAKVISATWSSMIVKYEFALVWAFRRLRRLVGKS